jgi:hypothetical protein
MLQFTNPRVAKKYRCLMHKDRMIHLPKIYSGLLSNISFAAAKAMHLAGTNLLEPIAPPPQEAPPEPTTDATDTP